MRLLISATAAMMVSGCVATTPKYTGPGGMQEFAKVRYQCVQETSARVSGAAINQYGGASNSKVIPSCSAFTACLASKGYYASPTGNLDPNAVGIGVTCD
jgi:hypothetical protein